MDQQKVAPRETVKIRFMGTITGGEKRVDVPIPFLAKSQHEGTLIFKTEASNGNKKPSAICDVPLHWGAILIDQGGFFECGEKLTPELKQQLKEAKSAYVEQQADLKAQEKALMEA